MTLHQRIAAALGWTVAEVWSFSLVALRERVRLASPSLADEITTVIERGRYIAQR